MKRPLLLGHRGTRKYAPENTIPAFDLALGHGCDGFEFDVRETSDHEAVICHDPKYEGLVVERSTRDQLLGRWHSVNGMTTLEEVLGKFSDSAFLNVELKVEGLERATIELLKQYPPTRGCIVSSFLPAVVEQLARSQFLQPLGIICDSHAQLSRWRELPITAVMAHRGLVTIQLIREVHAENKQVFVWTVNSAGEMRQFAEAGVDGIISDDTMLLASTLGSSGNAEAQRAR
jgi:glycerophosphoryl diester phosphodiesterase